MGGGTGSAMAECHRLRNPMAAFLAPK